MVKNLPQAIKLARRYETIQLSEIQRAFIRYKGLWVVNYLTGLGNGPKPCPLCQAISNDCSLCIYGEHLACTHLNERAARTYWACALADKPYKLLRAFRSRAKFLRWVIKQQFPLLDGRKLK